jgi:hypothetical protein
MTEDLQVAPDAATLINATETETPEVVTPEPEAEAAKEDTPKVEDDPLAKLQSRFDRRISRATAARYQADARAQQAEERAAALAAELAQYRTPEVQQQAPPVDPIQLANAIATVREVTAKSNAIAKEGGTRFQDFAQALKTVAEEAGPLFTQHGFATPLGEAIITAEDPALLLHHIGTHPDIAADLAELTPIQLGRRLDRIESEMKAKAAPKVSNAPKPLKPVSGSGSVSGYHEAMTDAQFAAWRKSARA